MSRVLNVAQNLAKWSEDFTQASAWNYNTGVTATGGLSTVPNPSGVNGGVTQMSYDGSGGASAFRFYQSCGTAALGRNYVESLWIRTLTGTKALYLVSNEAGQTTAFTATTTWQRVQVAGRSPLTTQAAILVVIYSPGGDNTPFDVYVWGAQAQQGLVAGPYVKTTTSALAAAGRSGQSGRLAQSRRNPLAGRVAA